MPLPLCGLVSDPVRYFRFLPSMHSRIVAHSFLHRHETPALHYTRHLCRQNWPPLLIFNFGTFVRDAVFIVDGLRRVLSVCLSVCSALPPVASSPFLQSRMHVLQEREPVDQG